jgi:hypothetical protein
MLSMHLAGSGESTARDQRTAMLAFEDVVVDPTDQALAELEPGELARFGMTREQLL